MAHPGSDPHVVVTIIVLKECEVVNKEYDIDQEPGTLQKRELDNKLHTA